MGVIQFNAEKFLNSSIHYFQMLAPVKQFRQERQKTNLRKYFTLSTVKTLIIFNSPFFQLPFFHD